MSVFAVTFDQFRSEVGNVDPGGPLSCRVQLQPWKTLENNT